MKRYKKKKKEKFKEGMFLVRNEKYPDSTTVKSEVWCVLRNIESPTELNVAWQTFCPGWNHQPNGIYPSKLFKRAPIWQKGTRLKHRKNNAECVVTKPSILLHNTILMKVKWIKWDKSKSKLIGGWCYPWNFEVIK